MIRQFFLTALFGFAVTFTFAQNDKKVNYPIQEVSKQLVETFGSLQIIAQNAKYYQIDVASLIPQMDGVMHRELPNSGFVANLSLPHPDGTFYAYRTMANSTLHPELNEKFPSIYTYDASGVQNGARVKWDITQHGLHAMIMIPGESTIFIDPVIQGNDDYYIVYRKSDFQTDKVFDCSYNSDANLLKSNNELGTVKSFGSCDLRTYRLALSATGEYTAFHGGTVAGAQAAQATSMNRVNGVFEKDMAITMVIIPNNDQIIYTDAGTDPFSNGNPGNMINENQTVCDGVIGNGNYDIGHVFGTDSGGLAGLGVVCNNANKARGVTGSGSPIGDTFDIDYVAHEMGHQFGANHTQNNNCNRNNATAMEPGSASTIMGYAGICAPNVQNNSDDHFHGVSLEEIGFEILSAGHTCEQITALANSAPIVFGTNGNVTVPANTPFALTATVTDVDGDPVTFNWEQMDPEVSTQSPVPTSTVGPNFRSYSSSASPTRYFPNLTDLANGGPFTWEVIPSVSRTMNFRVTVRDNAPGAGGCNDHADVTVTTDAGSGPFVVLYPSVTGIVWNANNTETVTWDVANTDQAPVACANVDILLSIDGGQTYPITLATNVPNDGSETITVPNLGTTTARIMVICSSGTFFDISDNDFEIVEATFDYTLTATPSTVTVCQPNDANFTVDIGSIDGYSDPVTLSVSGVPAGATSSISVNPVAPVGTSTLNVTNTGSAAPGDYTITITANSTSGTKTNDVILSILSSNPSPVTLTSPADLSTGVQIPTTLNWTNSTEPGVTYTVEIATAPGFTSIVESASGLTTNTYDATLLSPGTTYYWHVSVDNICGTSGFTSTFSFTTTTCILYASADVPVNIPNGTGTYTSTINVGTAGTINDVNVFDLVGNHGAVGNLIITLQSPLGTQVVLMDQSCGNQNDFDIDFDDEAASPTFPCPPIDGNAYQSLGLLSDFDGEDQQGTWTLIIQDVANPNSGALTGWSLEICSDPVAACAEPDVPSVSPSSSICAGQTATLSVTAGNLNDATDWTWYEGSCGGTLIGTGTSIVVTPGTAESYFVRGEGGCVTPGVCAQVDVQVNPIYNETDAATICQGASYTFGTQTLTAAGTYTEVFTSIDGCDSIVILTLDVVVAFNETDAVTICQGDSYSFGTQTLTASGTYTELFTSQNGCDSTVVLTLTVVTAFNETDAASICQGASYVFGTQTLTTAGTYTELFTSLSGCDSTVVLTLSVNPTYNETDAATICQGDSYVFGTQTLTAGGTYTELFPSVDGCDSIVVLTLTVNPVYNGVDAATICQGTTYPFGTQTLTTAGTYTEVFSSVDGCDSIVVLTLNVNQAYSEIDAVTICQGSSYTFGTQTLTAAGTYTELFSSIDGCDSTVVLTLDVVTVFNETDAATICQGDSYTFGTQTLTAAGTYTELFSSVNGCDSIVVLTLNVTSALITTDFIEICQGDTYTFGSLNLTSGGTYTQTFTAVGGCDSVVNLTLNVLPSITVTESAEICEGQTYTFPDGSLGTVTEAHISVLTGVNGCDSTVITALTVNASYNLNESVTICSGESYTFPDGTTGSTDMVYTSVLSTINGCDSIIVTDLVVQTIDNSVSVVNDKTITANQTGATYQWIDCDTGSPITAAINQSFTPTNTVGNYAVIITIGNCSDTSGCTLIDLTGMDEFEQSISIYPNPVSNELNISWAGDVTRIDVTDAKGKLIDQLVPNSAIATLLMRQYASGVYFIHIFTDSGRYVYDVLKQ
jgi:subtilisin-like proprotein convertase family protein